jgi:hypothetical protein
METSTDLEKGLLVTREQMLWLMNFLGAKSLLGVNLNNPPSGTDSKVPANPEAISLPLEENGILLREGKERNILNPEVRPLLEALFFPEQAMVVIRDRPTIGNQIFYLLRKGPILLMHSFPQEGRHFILPIAQPVEIAQILLDWFPLGLLPSSAAELVMGRDVFDRTVFLARRGGREEALKALLDFPVEEGERTNLINAIHHRKLSGTIGLLVFQSNTVDDASSVNVLTDGLTGWAITQEESSASQEPSLRVRRTGADFTMIVRELVEQFAGTKLPRQQTDGSGKTTRFLLHLDEIAMALASINCTELSQKMAAAAFQGITAGEYSERMKAAQQSLMDHGLCKLSTRGFPDLEPDLAKAVYTIATSDFMIELAACRKDAPANTCIHIVRGRFFAAYYNYGKTMQVLEFGLHKDLPSYLEFLFPDFGGEKRVPEKSFSISYTALEKALDNVTDRKKADRILRLDGLKASETNSLLDDLSDSDYRATFIRRDAPGGGEIADTPQSVPSLPALLLVKSPRRSLLFRFQDHDKKGEALAVTQAAFLKEASDFIA